MRGAPAEVLAAVGISSAATFTVVVLPHLNFASPRPPLHVALETAASLIALLAGSLVLLRLLRRGQFNELLLACALAVFALINIFLLTLPALVEPLTNDLTIWALIMGRSLGAALFAVAAFAPRRRLRRPGLALAGWVAAGSAAVLLTAALASLFAGHLAHSLFAPLRPDSPARPPLHAHSALLALQLASAVLFGAAAVGFVRRSRGLGDEFFGWLAITAVFAAFSHLNYFLHPSPYVQGVTIGDIFRLCAYAILLVGSMREIWSYWHTLSETAVLEERRRIARDLHDGLAQELAHLARNFDSLDEEPPEKRVAAIDRLRGAIERAQRESHRAVTTLVGPYQEPVEPSALALSLAKRRGALLELAVHLLGPFCVAIDDVAVGDWPSARCRSLFGYLLTHREPWPSREVLMEVFWPESAPQASRNSLNVAIHGLRRTLRTVTVLPVILHRCGAYGIHPDLRVWLDVEEFESRVEYGLRLEGAGDTDRATREYESADGLYRGDFLADDLYEDWATLTRERLRLAHLDALSRLSSLHFNAGRYAACASLCQRIVECDPCREDAHRRLMRCYSRQGQPHLALLQYRACIRALADQLGVDADPATAILHDQIRRHEPV